MKLKYHILFFINITLGVVLVHFLLLYQNSRDWVVYKENQFILLMVLETAKPKSNVLTSAQLSVRAFLLLQNISEGYQVARGQKRAYQLRFLSLLIKPPVSSQGFYPDILILP